MSNDSKDIKEQDEKRYSFKDEINVFVSYIDSLASTVPVFMSFLLFVEKEDRNKILKFISDIEVKNEQNQPEDAKKINEPEMEEKNEEIKISFEDKIRLEKIAKKIKRIELAAKILPNSFIITLISQFDAYLGRLIRTMFFVQPEILNSSQKNILLSDLISFGSIEEAQENIVEQEIESVLRESHSKHFDWLEGKLGIPLRKKLNLWPDFIEITERRNLFTHCNGVVSTQYLNVCKKHNVVFDNNCAVGDELGVKPEYFKKSYNCIFAIGVMLGHVMWRKLLPGEIDESDDNLISITYDLIEKKNYDLAITILEFIKQDIKKFASAESRYILIINLAQAYKWSGENKKCIDLLSETDWSTFCYKFRICVAVLEDDFDAAITLMHTIGKSNEIRKIEYREWPIFKDLRKNDKFRESFEEIFGEPVEVIEHEQLVDMKKDS